MGSPHIILFWVFFFFFFEISVSPSNSISLALKNNFTFYGDARFLKDTISLTQEISSTSSSSPPPSSSSSPSFPTGIGRALYTNPIRFLDPSTNFAASFSCRFSFTITPTPSSPSGEGLTFLITSNASSISNSFGYMGLPYETSGTQESFLAVEFDTSFDSYLGDINDNHIGLDVNTPASVSSVGADSVGIDLKSGKHITAWVEYDNDKKIMSVWVNYSPFKPPDPILSTPIDLSQNVLKEFMHIGFSASNGRLGSAHHLVGSWQFRTFRFLSSDTTKDTVEEDVNDGCPVCFADSGDFDEQYSFFHFPPGRETSKSKWVVPLLVGVALLLVFMAAVACCIWLKRRKGDGRRGNGIGRDLPTRLSLAEVKSATRGFHQSRIIGEGASGVVYVGSLASGKEVAIKRFNQLSQVDPFLDPFTNELAAMVGCLKHKNLVQLIGFCCEGNELLLVYEHMANGSLDKILHRIDSAPRTILTWERRLKIVLGVASALTYLHEECETQIIHRDVKACNIMLDAEYNAKLGDFGLAELYERSSSTIREATVPAGTMGYLAPEYVHSGVPTEKTDVYSFGVVVLEVATGMRPVDSDGIVLVDRLWEMWARGKLMEVVDSRLRGRFERVEMEGMLMVGLACVHPDYTKRPKMKEAERMLRGEAPFPILPSRRPEMRLLSPLPQGAEDILLAERRRNSNGTPWATPRTHFS